MSLIICFHFSGFSTTTTVLNSGDTGTGSLREAITTATAGDTILFDATLSGETITLASELSLISDLTIDGEDKDITINGDDTYRCISVDGNYTLNLRNIRLTNGAAIGGAINSQNGGDLHLLNVKIENCNSDNDGAGIRVFEGVHSFTNVQFSGNQAISWGGAFYNLFGNVTFDNTVFSGNRAGRGGAIYNRGVIDITNCTFNGNNSFNATGGGGALYISSEYPFSSKNSIYYNNEDFTGVGTRGAFFQIDGVTTPAITLTNNLIEGSGGSDAWNTDFGTDLGGNIDGNPEFILAIGPDLAPTTDGNYRLTAPSIAINAGNNSFVTTPVDLNQNPRIIYGNVDLGAYETCSSTNAFDVVVCDSLVSPSGLYTWMTSGMYNDTLANDLGCDSVLTFTLTVNESDDSSYTVTTCDSLVSPSGDYTWYTTGMYMDTILTVTGCDSILFIDLTINNSTLTEITEIVCDSLVSPSGTYTWYTTGNYSDTLTTEAGCDSIISFDLTVNYPTTASISEAVCNEMISPSGLYTWTTTGVYLDTITNATGCDSIMTIDLTVNFGDMSTVIDTTVCDTYTSPSGQIWNTTGTYTDTLSSSTSCDSILTINLNIPAIDLSLNIGTSAIGSNQ